jgi:hypothetical protein
LDDEKLIIKLQRIQNKIERENAGLKKLQEFKTLKQQENNKCKIQYLRFEQQPKIYQQWQLKIDNPVWYYQLAEHRTQHTQRKPESQVPQILHADKSSGKPSFAPIKFFKNLFSTTKTKQLKEIPMDNSEVKQLKQQYIILNDLHSSNSSINSNFEDSLSSSDKSISNIISIMSQPDEPPNSMVYFNENQYPIEIERQDNKGFSIIARQQPKTVQITQDSLHDNSTVIKKIPDDLGGITTLNTQNLTWICTKDYALKLQQAKKLILTRQQWKKFDTKEYMNYVKHKLKFTQQKNNIKFDGFNEIKEFIKSIEKHIQAIDNIKKDMQSRKTQAEEAKQAIRHYNKVLKDIENKEYQYKVQKDKVTKIKKFKTDLIRGYKQKASKALTHKIRRYANLKNFAVKMFNKAKRQQEKFAQQKERFYNNKNNFYANTISNFNHNKDLFYEKRNRFYDYKDSMRRFYKGQIHALHNMNNDLRNRLASKNPWNNYS